MEYAANKQPWERQPGEPELWFGRFFEFYLIADSLLGAVHFCDDKEEKRRKKKTPEPWVNKSKDWQWKERKAAYVDEQNKKLQALRDERFESFHKNEIERRLTRLELLGDKLEKVLAGVGELKDENGKLIIPYKLSEVASFSNAYFTASKSDAPPLKGQPEENKRIIVEQDFNKKLDGMTIDELDGLINALAKRRVNEEGGGDSGEEGQ